MWARYYRNNWVEVNPEVREIKHNNQMTENPKSVPDTNVLIK